NISAVGYCVPNIILYPNCPATRAMRLIILWQPFVYSTSSSDIVLSGTSSPASSMMMNFLVDAFASFAFSAYIFLKSFISCLMLLLLFPFPPRSSSSPSYPGCGASPLPIMPDMILYSRSQSPSRALGWNTCEQPDLLLNP